MPCFSRSSRGTRVTTGRQFVIAALGNLLCQYAGSNVSRP
jgi:hypothetical protein